MVYLAMMNSRLVVIGRERPLVAVVNTQLWAPRTALFSFSMLLRLEWREGSKSISKIWSTINTHLLVFSCLVAISKYFNVLLKRIDSFR